MTQGLRGRGSVYSEDDNIRLEIKFLTMYDGGGANNCKRLLGRHL